MTTKKTTQDVRNAVLDKALPDIIFDGWTMPVIEKAAEEAEINSLQLKAAFPDGLTSVLDAFADKADKDMLAALETIQKEDLKIRERVRIAIITRLEQLAPHKEAVKASLKFWLNPVRKARAGKITWRTADRIWDWAGDTATDYNRYTKRGLLSGILASSIIVWLNDDSEDMHRTINFVENRIKNIMQVGKIIGRIKA